MPSKLNAYLLSAVILAALLQCAPGAPVEDAPTDSPEGDPSGEEEEEMPYDIENACLNWNSLLGATKPHQNEFEAEFQNQVTYISLGLKKISSLPPKCPLTNFSKEACLHRMAEGLLVYTVLLKYVEKECPSSQIPKNVRYFSGLLINTIKQKMRNPEQVTALTSSQENKLLKDLENPDPFQRKMTAHSILRELPMFLVDCKRVINKKEMARASMANRSMAPITFYCQKSKR